MASRGFSVVSMVVGGKAPLGDQSWPCAEIVKNREKYGFFRSPREPCLFRFRNPVRDQPPGPRGPKRVFSRGLDGKLGVLRENPVSAQGCRPHRLRSKMTKNPTFLPFFCTSLSFPPVDRPGSGNGSGIEKGSKRGILGRFQPCQAEIWCHRVVPQWPRRAAQGRFEVDFGLKIEFLAVSPFLEQFQTSCTLFRS